ncbi:MAG: hypothetical protein QOK05_2768 [Chloroflexota bacterium]|nr:hypothetical protein [Chloroflexota bacterium]
MTNTVGRKDRITNMVPDVDLGTLDQERSVSRRHAELAYEHGTILLRDLGSTNGTSVNGERLMNQVDRALQDGDRVGFGGVEMSFSAVLAWPDGVEAEWPPETTPEETMISSPEETMISGPQNAEETMISPASAFPRPEVADEPPALPDAVAAAPEPNEASEASIETEPETPVAPPPAPQAPVYEYVACSNHPHLPALGVCPGCLEAFCVDCLPERVDGLMVCNRCAGIIYRLGAAETSTSSGGGQAMPAPAMAAQAAAPESGAAETAIFPDPMPAAAMPPAAAPSDGEDKKKKWPF